MRHSTEHSPGVAQKIFDFYLFSNLHIAVCAVALVLVTREFFGLHLRTELLVFVFCGTFFLYNLQRLPAAFSKGDIDRKFMRHRWNTEHRVLLLLISVIAALAAAWSFFLLYPRTQLIALLPAALSVAYAFPSFYWNRKWIKLREIPVLKIFIVAVVWGMICVWLPVAADDSYPQWYSPEVMVWFVSCSLMIFAITVPFDIRDLTYDGQTLSTIPAMAGVKRAVMVALAALLLSAGGVFLADYMTSLVTMHHAVFYFAWSVVTGVLIAFSKPSLHEYYFSFLMDGVMILLWAMIAFL